MKDEVFIKRREVEERLLTTIKRMGILLDQTLRDYNSFLETLKPILPYLRPEYLDAIEQGNRRFIDSFIDLCETGRQLNQDHVDDLLISKEFLEDVLTAIDELE